MTNEIKQRVLEIMELAVTFNDSETRQELTGNKPTFFVEFYGHICGLEVRANINGYPESPVYLSGEGATSRYEATFLDVAEKPVLHALDTVLAEMRRIINRWEAAAVTLECSEENENE